METRKTEIKNYTNAFPIEELETETRIIITAETYLELYSPPRAYHEDPYYVYGTLYEKGETLDIGARYCPLHIYWDDEPVGEEFFISTSGETGNEGYFRVPIPVNQTEGTYPMFIEFRGQVIINNTNVYEYDPTNETLDPEKNPDSTMFRYPSNFTVDVEVFYHSFIDASISTSWITAGESFWINGSLNVYETGEPIFNARMNITMDSKKIGEIRSSPSGEFNEKLRLMNSTAPGPHKLRVDFWQFHFQENALYGSSYTTFDVHFVQLVVMDFSVTSLTSGEKIYINGTLSDLRGESLQDPIEPDKIYYLEGEIVNCTEGDSYGLDSIEVLNGTSYNITSVLPKNFRAGLAKVILAFNKDNLYGDSESTKEVMISTIPSIEIDSFSFNKPIENVSGRVTDSGGRGLSIPLKAYINGTEAGFGSSDENGDFRFAISLTDEIGIGSVKVQVEAISTYRSQTSHEEIEIEVYSSAVLRCELMIDKNNIKIDYARPGDGKGLLNITYIVSNEGNVVSEPCQVFLRSLPELEKSVFLDSILPGDTVEKYFQWAVKDNITMDFVVDPEGIVSEIDEGNNIISIRLEQDLYDLDGDGDYNYVDEDTDGDEFLNDKEIEAGSDPYDKDSIPAEVPDGNTDKNEGEKSPWWIYIIGIFVVIGVIAIITMILKRSHQK